MNEPNQNPTPEQPAPPTPVATTPAPEAAVPAAVPTPAAPPPGPQKGPRKPFRSDRPNQPDRPQLDFTSLTTNIRLNELDKSIEDELAAAMSGFETEINQDAEAA